MSEKSHVGMGYQVCPVCYKKHDETVLLDRRLRNTLERDNFTGFSLCDEHRAMTGEYLAIVEAEAPTNRKSIQMSDAKPTGRYAHIRRSRVKDVFNVDIPDDLDLIYVEVGVIDKLQGMAPAAEGASA